MIIRMKWDVVGLSEFLGGSGKVISDGNDFGLRDSGGNGFGMDFTDTSSTDQSNIDGHTDFPLLNVNNYSVHRTSICYCFRKGI